MEAKTLISELDNIVLPIELSLDSIKDSFEKKIDQLSSDIEISVEEIDVDEEGIIVTLGHKESLFPIVFQYDLLEGPQALIAGETEEDSIAVSLDFLNPALVLTSYGTYLNLSDLSWVSPSFLVELLQLAGLPLIKATLIPPKYDEFGQLLNPTGESLEINELFKTVVRGGKKVKIPLVRRLKKKRLSPKQRAGLRKALLKRRSKRSQIARKRKKSMSVRKRTHLKKAKLPKSRFGYKAA